MVDFALLLIAFDKLLISLCWVVSNLHVMKLVEGHR